VTQTRLRQWGTPGACLRRMGGGAHLQGGPSPLWAPERGQAQAPAPAELPSGFGKRALEEEFERSGELHVLQERGGQLETMGRGGREGRKEGGGRGKRRMGYLGAKSKAWGLAPDGSSGMQERRKSPLSEAMGGENQILLALHAASSLVSVDSNWAGTDDKENQGGDEGLSASEGEPLVSRPGQLAWHARPRKSRALNPFLQDLPDDNAAGQAPQGAGALQEPHPLEAAASGAGNGALEWGRPLCRCVRGPGAGVGAGA